MKSVPPFWRGEKGEFLPVKKTVLRASVPRVHRSLTDGGLPGPNPTLPASSRTRSCARARPTACTSRRGTRSTAPSAAAASTRRATGMWRRGRRRRACPRASVSRLAKLVLFPPPPSISQDPEGVAEKEVLG